MESAPIILFAYKRPELIRQLLISLAANKEAAESPLFIFCDGAKPHAGDIELQQILSTREVIRERQWCKSVVIRERTEHAGLAKSIVEGVSEIIHSFGRAVVLEDDLLLSPYFLKYMNEALEIYEKNDRVISIHGYVYPLNARLPETFFIRGADCWGWATWKRGWSLFENDGKKLLNALRENRQTGEFDFNHSYKFTRLLRNQVKGKNNAWDILWYASAYLNEKMTLYPGRSLVSHLGNDNCATHMTAKYDFTAKISDEPVQISELPVEHNKTAAKCFEQYFRSINPPLHKRIAKKISRLIPSAGDNFYNDPNHFFPYSI